MGLFFFRLAFYKKSVKIELCYFRNTLIQLLLQWHGLVTNRRASPTRPTTFKNSMRCVCVCLLRSFALCRSRRHMCLQLAVELIQRGLAYVCHQTGEEAVCESEPGSNIVFNFRRFFPTVSG